MTTLSILTALLSLSTPAQVLYGSIVGTIEDQSGSVVPDAQIVLTNRSTGCPRSPHGY